jgi:hypothetical protein
MADEQDPNETRKIAVSNNAPGPRFLYAKGTKEILRSGETRELEMTKAEAKAGELPKIEGTDLDVFGFSNPGGEEHDAFEGATVTQLREVAEKEQIDLGTATKRADIITKIVEGRAAKS